MVQYVMVFITSTGLGEVEPDPETELFLLALSEIKDSSHSLL